MNDLYTDNYKTLIKENEDDAKQWKDSSCSYTGRTNIVKMAVYRFNVISNKIHRKFFIELGEKS